MSSPKGFPSNQKLVLPTEGQSNAFTTVVPTDPYRHGLDIPRFAFRVDNPTVPRTAGATTGNPTNGGPTFVEDASTPARIGDFVRFMNGASEFLEVPIVAIAPGGNGFYLSARLSTVPSSGDEFYIMRYATQQVDENGSQLVVTSPGPSQFVLDGVDVEVEQDTVTPSNSKPFPVALLDTTGTPFDPATEGTALNIESALTNDGRSVVNTIFYDYASGSVDNTTWVEIIASTSAKANSFTLFDSGGYAMEIGVGPSSSETRLFVVPPGGFNGEIKIAIPSGSRLSVRCLETQTVSVGLIVINLLS